jgi:hypothetical protein
MEEDTKDQIKWAALVITSGLAIPAILGMVASLGLYIVKPDSGITKYQIKLFGDAARAMTPKFVIDRRDDANFSSAQTAFMIANSATVTEDERQKSLDAAVGYLREIKDPTRINMFVELRRALDDAEFNTAVNMEKQNRYNEASDALDEIAEPSRFNKQGYSLLRKKTADQVNAADP